MGAFAIKRQLPLVATDFSATIARFLLQRYWQRRSTGSVRTDLVRHVLMNIDSDKKVESRDPLDNRLRIMTQ